MSTQVSSDINANIKFFINDEPLRRALEHGDIMALENNALCVIQSQMWYSQIVGIG